MTLGEKTLDNNQLTHEGNQTVPGPSQVHTRSVLAPLKVPLHGAGTDLTWTWYGARHTHVCVKGHSFS